MKRIVNISLLLGATLSITSCKNVLEAPAKSSLDESVIFSTPSLAEGVIPGILQSFGETNSYRGRYLVYYGTNTDVEVHNSLKAIDDEKDRKSTRLNSSHVKISYAVFCLKKKKI